MKVFITGINGFIASHLCITLKNEGYDICGSTSQQIVQTRDSITKEAIFHYKLGEQLDNSILKGVDVVIHCAHDFERGALTKNVEGTLALAEVANSYNVIKQIFISSLSARPDAQTEYGKAKFQIELYFKRNNYIILRPGTVLGSGGIFNRMVSVVRNFPIVPLPDGGNSRVYVISVDDLCRSISKLLSSNCSSGEFNLYYPEIITLKNLLVAVRNLTKRNTKILSIPSKILILPLSILGAAKINLPVDIDNLRSFIISQSMPYQSDLKKVLSSYMSIKEALSSQLVT